MLIASSRVILLWPERSSAVETVQRKTDEQDPSNGGMKKKRATEEWGEQ